MDCITPIDEPLPLRFGDLVHQSLDKWYVPGRKRGVHPAKTFKEVYNAADKTFGIRDAETDEWSNAEELGVAMLKNYVNTFGKDSDWTVIAPEMQFQVVLLDKHGNPYVRVLCKVDVVVRSRSTGRISLVEHKTAKSVRTGHLTLDDQAGTYLTFAPVHLQHLGLLKPGEEIEQIVYNYLRKAKPDQRPQDERGRYLNKDGSVSKKQPAPYFVRHPVPRSQEDKDNLVDRIRKQVWEMDKVRSGELPVYKSTSFRCPGCKFFGLCELHETGADYEEYIQLSFKKRNTYEDYDEFELDDADSN